MFCRNSQKLAERNKFCPSCEDRIPKKNIIVGITALICMAITLIILTKDKNDCGIMKYRQIAYINKDGNISIMSDTSCYADKYEIRNAVLDGILKITGNGILYYQSQDSNLYKVDMKSKESIENPTSVCRVNNLILEETVDNKLSMMMSSNIVLEENLIGSSIDDLMLLTRYENDDDNEHIMLELYDEDKEEIKLLDENIDEDKVFFDKENRRIYYMKTGEIYSEILYIDESLEPKVIKKIEGPYTYSHNTIDGCGKCYDLIYTKDGSLYAYNFNDFKEYIVIEDENYYKGLEIDDRFSYVTKDYYFVNEQNNPVAFSSVIELDENYNLDSRIRELIEESEVNIPKYTLYQGNEMILDDLRSNELIYFEDKGAMCYLKLRTNKEDKIPLKEIVDNLKLEGINESDIKSYNNEDIKEVKDKIAYTLMRHIKPGKLYFKSKEDEELALDDRYRYTDVIGYSSGKCYMVPRKDGMEEKEQIICLEINDKGNIDNIFEADKIESVKIIESRYRDHFLIVEAQDDNGLISTYIIIDGITKKLYESNGFTKIRISNKGELIIINDILTRATLFKYKHGSMIKVTEKLRNAYFTSTGKLVVMELGDDVRAVDIGICDERLSIRKIATDGIMSIESGIESNEIINLY